MEDKKLPIYKIENFEFYNKSFYSSDLKTHIKKHGFIHHPHKHNFYLTVLFTQGSGVHEIDFVTYPVESGALFFLKPQQVHRWTLTEDTDGFIFFHTREFYDITYLDKRITDFEFFSYGGVTPFIQLRGNIYNEAVKIFQRIESHYNTTDSQNKYETISTLCNLLYLDIEREYGKETNNSNEGSRLYQTKIRTLTKLIATNYRELHYPKEYAALMNTSVKHLNRICNTLANKTTNQLIAERITLEAKRILAYSDNPIKQIAEDLGFNDPAYFIRFFKKNTGQTPYIFSKQLRENTVKNDKDL